MAMMKSPARLMYIALFVIAAGSTVYSQDEALKEFKPEFFIGTDRTTVDLIFPKPPTQEFISRYSEQTSTYRLYEVEAPDPEKECVYPKCILEWKDFLKAGPECSSKTDCPKLTLQLNRELPAGKNFVLVVDGLQESGKLTKVTLSIESKAEIASSLDAFKQRSAFRIRAKFPLKSTDSVTALRVVYRIKGKTPETLRAEPETEKLTATLDSALSQPDRGTLSYKLEQKLKEGSEYNVSVKDGVTTVSGKPVEVKGTIKTPGAPAAPAASKITGTLALNAARGEKAVFDLSGSVTPLRVPAIGPFFWEPTLAVDLGLRSTKSNNSVTIASPFTLNFGGQDKKELPVSTAPALQTGGTGSGKPDKPQTNIRAYAMWKNTPWYYLDSIKFYIGPKGEFDRNFKRKNLLGNLRFDFNFHRWLGTISERRALITDADNGIGEEKGKALEGINFGFKLVPYVATDFGGHVNNETVSKDNASVFVPRHTIFRAYSGFTGIIEWRLFDLPMSLNLDESVSYLAREEQIGYKTDDGVFLRRIKGVHPHLKTSIDFGFDPAKHYSLTFEYENGRQAPNFEYLNKFTAGIKVTY
jgi:hypothetical protein